MNPWSVFESPRRTVYFVDIAAAAAAQLLRPTSDISTNGWTSSLGGALYAAVDEVSADDADYIYSPDNPTTQQAEVKFGAGTGTPSSVTVRVRLQAIGQDTNFDIDLVQGASILASWTENVTVAAGAVTREHVAGSISVTDAADLRVRVVARA